MLTQPGSLKRNRHPISYVLYPGQVRIAESARYGRNDGQHTVYPALGQNRDGHQRLPGAALGLRKIGASPCELTVGGEEVAQVGQIRFGICGGRCCSDSAMAAQPAWGELRHHCTIGEGALYSIGVWESEERVRTRWASEELKPAAGPDR